MDTQLLASQQAYYNARAAEYDEWWLRQGRYDRGPEHTAAWVADTQEAAAALAAAVPQPVERALELACGTGLWTARLRRHCRRITAVDGSAEMLALHAGKFPNTPGLDRLQADLFSWEPGPKLRGQQDLVFFGFWLSHLPAERFDAFWRLVRQCLAPGGKVFFVDSLRDPASTAVDHTLPPAESQTLARKLNDGREFQICKVFYEPSSLQARLAALGWKARVNQTAQFFLYGEAQLIPQKPYSNERSR